MTAISAHSIECPYCTSQVVTTVHHDGRLEVHHLEEFGPDCETGLQHLLAEETKKAGMRIMFRN